MPLDGVNGTRPPGTAGSSETAEGAAPDSSGAAAPVPAETAASRTAGAQGALQDPGLAAIVAEARAIAAELRLGNCESREEATRRLVREVLARRLKLSGAALTRRVATALREDPRLGQALERIWSEGD